MNQSTVMIDESSYSYRVNEHFQLFGIEFFFLGNPKYLGPRSIDTMVVSSIV